MLTSSVREITSVSGGTDDAFPLSEIRFWRDDDIVVYLDDGGELTRLQAGVDYRILGDGKKSEGRIQPLSVRPAGVLWRVRRVTAGRQDIKLRHLSELPPAQLESQLDRLAAGIVDNRGDLSGQQVRINNLETAIDALSALDLEASLLQEIFDNLPALAQAAALDDGNISALLAIYDDLLGMLKEAPLGAYAELVTAGAQISRRSQTFTVGAQRFTPKFDASLPIVLANPFDASDWLEIVEVGGAQQSDVDGILRRLARLERKFPPSLPVWNYDIPLIKIPNNADGVVFDLAPYIQDDDSLIEEIRINPIDPLPAGISIVGRQIVADSPTITAAADYFVQALDESEQWVVDQRQGAFLNIEIYDSAGTTPDRPPTWEDLPLLQVTRGEQIAAFSVTTYANDPDGNDGAITFAVTGLPAGLDFDGAVISGSTLEAAQDYTLSWTATDEDGLPRTAEQTLRVNEASAPEWTDIPVQIVERGDAIEVVNYLAYVSDANTPDSELELSVEGRPNGTTFINNELKGAPIVDGTYQIYVTAVNNAGLEREKRHTIVVSAPTGGTTGGGGGGGGGGTDDGFTTEFD